MDYKVYIYGAGYLYNELMSYIHYYDNLIKVEGILTTEKNNYSRIDGYECLTVDEAIWENIDYCIVAVYEWNDIRKKLCELGMENKIIRSHIFRIPNFDFEKYIKLKNSEITILCNYCLGGHLYREFGLKELSPTINMFCSGMQYIDFLENYEYYLSFDMKEKIGDIEHRDGTIGIEEFWPHGIVGGEEKTVEWVLNHDTEPGISVRKWNSRRCRVNYDNIVAIMIIQSDQEAYAFDKLNIERKIGFYYKNLGLENVICINEWSNKKNIIEFDSMFPFFVNNYMRNFAKEVPIIDWMKFFNGEKEFVRKI